LGGKKGWENIEVGIYRGTTVLLFVNDLVKKK
jgi:hypothetical protein